MKLFLKLSCTYFEIAFKFSSVFLNELVDFQIPSRNFDEAEIFLIWTNVARTNVALTNVTMTVYICTRGFQEHTFKVWSKSGQ